jgi:hypothetical protein
LLPTDVLGSMDSTETAIDLQPILCGRLEP